MQTCFYCGYWQLISFSAGPFSLHIVIKNLFFIVFLPKWTVFVARKESKMEIWTIKSFSLDHEASKHRNNSLIQVFSNTLRSYEICGVLCRMTWIIFNQCFNLAIINDCRPAGSFLVLQSLISFS